MFLIIKDKFYQVIKVAQTKEETTQFLVPKIHQRNLGQDKTVHQLMAHFYWLGICSDVLQWWLACRECQLMNPPATTDIGIGVQGVLQHTPPPRQPP